MTPGFSSAIIFLPNKLLWVRHGFPSVTSDFPCYSSTFSSCVGIDMPWGGGKSQSFLRKHSCSLLESLPLCQGLRPREDQFHLASLWGHLLEEKVSFGVRMARSQLDWSLSFIRSLLETRPYFILRYSVDFHQASEISAFSFFSQLRRCASLAKLSTFVKWSRGKSGG